MTADITGDIAPGSWNPKRDRAKLVETIVKIIFGAFAAISIFTTIGILGTLIFETVAFFQEVSIVRFLPKPAGRRCLPVSSSVSLC